MAVIVEMVVRQHGFLERKTERRVRLRQGLEIERVRWDFLRGHAQLAEQLPPVHRASRRDLLLRREGYPPACRKAEGWGLAEVTFSPRNHCGA